MPPQISVLDAGGQYCHLIARRVRELGVYADVHPSEVSATALAGRKGIIISGGPSSVYDPGSPDVDPAIFSTPSAVLGICYGHQLMAHHLGGTVRKGEKGEYGLAFLEPTGAAALFGGLDRKESVWMSHRDLVTAAPPAFRVLARTETCPVAAMVDDGGRLYGVQFHPEVVHTRRGQDVLRNFLFEICGCEKDWQPTHQIPEVERQIRETAAGRNVFFFASGGVDSTVAFSLCLRALGPERVRAAYVDTGLMREGETDFVREVFEAMASGVFQVVDASEEFVGALAGVTDPEKKRHIIGEEFVAVQERVLASSHFMDGQWILGQGTIYPDTIESGGTQKADLIKTHHNRVAGIQKLLAENRIVEPLSQFYKDEVRELGRAMGLPGELLDRHPFPGPGLAIRCLCSDVEDTPQETEDGWIIPVRSVGVQGDSRSYQPVLAIDKQPTEELALAATYLVNRLSTVNRVMAVAASHAHIGAMKVSRAAITEGRLARLRKADATVRRLTATSGLDAIVWQFPVVTIPVGTTARPDSVVLRPVDSVDGMTASAVLMPRELLDELCTELLAVEGVCAVFYDLTHKPPATIEWE